MLDCDGTLFESYEANVAYYEAILARIGRPRLDEEGRDLAHRMAAPQLFEHLLRDDPNALARALEIARRTDYTPFLQRMQPMPRLFETLAWLHDRFKTALVTNRGATIPSLLAHFDLGRHFDLVVGVQDVERPKPAPDMLLRCLEHFAVAPSQAVYVGDSTGDLEASLAAGVEFIAVGDGAVQAAEPAMRRLASFAELPGLLG